MLFVATNVPFGTLGTLLEHSGTLETCWLLSFAERLGSEEIGKFPGIAYNVTHSIGIVQKRKLW